MSDSKTSPEQGAKVGNGEELENLRTRLEKTEQERAQYLDLAQRTKADFENYQKRISRDMLEERRYAVTPLARDILPALDNLNRALEAARQAGDTGPLTQGVALVQTQLLDLLKRHGITPIESQGKPFDPNVHEAVRLQPSAEHPPNTVLLTLEQGFLMHDRVLRPARVIVTTATGSGSKNE